MNHVKKMGENWFSHPSAWCEQLIAEAESKLHIPSILKHELAPSSLPADSSTDGGHAADAGPEMTAPKRTQGEKPRHDAMQDFQ
jgi:hypothetical protein